MRRFFAMIMRRSCDTLLVVARTPASGGKISRTRRVKLIVESKGETK